MSASPKDQRPPSAVASRSDDSRYLPYGPIAEQLEAARRSGRRPDGEALEAEPPDMAKGNRGFVAA